LVTNGDKEWDKNGWYAISSRIDGESELIDFNSYSTVTGGIATMPKDFWQPMAWRGRLTISSRTCRRLDPSARIRTWRALAHFDQPEGHSAVKLGLYTTSAKVKPPPFFLAQRAGTSRYKER
jgi:hypothetical protein